MSTLTRRARRAKKKTLAAVALIAALALCACAPGTDDAGKVATAATAGQAEAGAYPVTIKHALGEVTLDQEPQRIAVIGWTTPDIVVALGRVPVAVARTATERTTAGTSRGSATASRNWMASCPLRCRAWNAAKLISKNCWTPLPM